MCEEGEEASEMPGGLSRSGYSAAAILELLFLNNTNVRKGNGEEGRGV